jgi:hypothetical protein
MPREHSLTSVLLIWLLPQLLSLLVSTLRIPLSAHPPRPMESVALQQMIIVQICAAAVLAPILFRSLAAGVAVILSAAPMLLLAGFLSSAALSKTIALYQLGASWALTLVGCCALLSERREFEISAAAAGWAVGGLVIAYLNAEFASTRALSDLLLGPAVIAARVSGSASPPSPTFWLLTASFTTLGLAMLYVARRRARATTAS